MLIGNCTTSTLEISNFVKWSKPRQIPPQTFWTESVLVYPKVLVSRLRGFQSRIQWPWGGSPPCFVPNPLPPSPPLLFWGGRPLCSIPGNPRLSPLPLFLFSFFYFLPSPLFMKTQKDVGGGRKGGGGNKRPFLGGRRWRRMWLLSVQYLLFDSGGGNKSRLGDIRF